MFKLVKNNVEALYQDIPTECLCKTFTGALEVIRITGIGYCQLVYRGPLAFSFSGVL
jgi:hypothetical protein